MRYSSKKIVLAMLTVLFAVLLAAVPMTAFAADVAESISVVTIAAEGVSISPDEAKEDKTVIHAMTVELEGGSVSSFEMQIRMPAFVDVSGVKESERLAAVSENGVFEWYIDKESGYVNVTYSSPNEYAYIPLFDIEFTVNDYTVQYAAVECVSVRTVDTDYNELPTHVAFGAIAIGEVSSTTMGDVDGNGLVNLADLLVIQRSIVNPNYPLNEVQYALADINRDGAVNIVDCQYIQNYLVGKLDSLENVGQQTVVYTYNMSMGGVSEDGVASVTDVSYIFYSNGIVRATMTLTVDGKLEREETQEAIWLQVGQYIDITFEGETERLFQVDEYGNLSIYQDGGSDVQPEQTELSEYKNKYYNEVKMSWSELTQKYGDLSAYEDMLKEIFTGIENATSISEVNSWYETFEQLRRKITANEGGTTVEDHVVSTRTEFGDIGITVGASYEDLLSKIVGQIIYVTYSQSGLIEVPITEDMIDCKNVMLDTVGNYPVMITYVAKDGSYHNYHISVYVNPDMSGVKVLGTYKIEFDGEFGFTEFTLYEGDVAVMNGGYYDNVFTTYYMVSEGVAAVDMEGGYLVFALGEGVASFYQPEGELEVIGTYVYDTPYGALTLLVYGEYTGAGNYVAVMNVQQKNPETGEMMEMTITTTVYLDKENCEIRHAMFGNMSYDEAGKIYCPHTEVRTEGWDGDCYSNGWRRTYCANCYTQLDYQEIPTTGHNFDENGYCDRCGMNESGVSDDLNNYKNQILEQMIMEWSDIVNSMPISEDLQQRFNELTAVIKEAESREAVDNLYYNDFRWLCDEARMSTNVYLKDWEMNPGSYHVTVGTSLEQFIAEFVKNVTITVYYSDGTSAIYPVTEDMLKYSDLDLSVVGRTYMSVSYHDELTGSGIGFGVSVYVDPDMTGAQVIGNYTYVGEIMNGMEWDRAELYDNGIMILYCGDETPEFVAYTLSDGVLSYEIYGATIAYKIVNDSELSYYKPEKVIGSYTYVEDDEEGFTMTVFDECNEAGEYYAYIEMFEICEDGTYERYGATTLVIFDRDANKIYCELIGGWCAVDEEGMISPMECEHSFDESGVCIYCGSHQGGSNGSESDSVVDSEKLPAVEVETPTDGEVSYTEGVYSTVA